MEGWFALFMATGQPVFYLWHRQKEMEQTEEKTA